MEKLTPVGVQVAPSGWATPTDTSISVGVCRLGDAMVAVAVPVLRWPCRLDVTTAPPWNSPWPTGRRLVAALGEPPMCRTCAPSSVPIALSALYRRRLRKGIAFDGYFPAVRRISDRR